MAAVLVHHCGYTATVKAVGNVNVRKPKVQDIEIDDQPDGGANSLNINRFEQQAILHMFSVDSLKMISFLHYMSYRG